MPIPLRNYLALVLISLHIMHHPIKKKKAKPSTPIMSPAIAMPLPLGFLLVIPTIPKIAAGIPVKKNI